MSERAALPAVLRAGLWAWAGLLALQVLWHGWLAPPQRMPLAFALGASVLPLLLPLLALRRPRRALLWVGIFSLFYFCHGVAESWSSPAQRWLALLEVGLTLCLIAALGASVRGTKGRAQG